MKTSNDLNLRSGINELERDSQLYHKHTFGSMGNNMNSPTSIGQFGNRKAPLPSIQNLSEQQGFAQTATILPQQQQIQPSRHIKTSILSTAISSLTYGLSCLIYETQTNMIYECLMMVHQEYINILHVIINRSISYLLKLHDVKSITDQDTFVASKLNGLNINSQLKQNYIVLNLKSLKSLVFLFRTQHQKYTIHLGLRFFLNQGTFFYSKLSQYDPFKAQSMMLFLQADKDGGNLLDIQEIISILEQLKIDKQKIDIQTDVLEINKSLYQRQNMKRPKNASPQQLTPIAFQYLLRYYSIKEQLLKFFKQYCPMFKPKNKNHKNTIIDIIKNNQKPIMSSFQLKQFYRQILKEQDKSLEQLDQIIKKFPVYDGQGKQKFDAHGQQILLSFDNFCNLICSKENSLILSGQQECGLSGLNRNQQLQINSTQKPNKHYLSYSLLNYHIYTDQSMKNHKRKQKSNFFTLALKRGVKCINLQLNISMLNASSRHTQSSQMRNKNITQSQQKLSALVVRIDQKQKQQLLLDDILKDVKMYAFDKNNLPFFIVLDIDSLFKQPNYVQYLQLLNQVIEDSLEKDSIFIFMGNKEQKRSLLPTPLQLQGKIMFLTTLNPKILQKTFALKSQIQIPKSLTKKITFNAVKLDFQRKGQNCWNICFIDLNDLKNYQSAEQENICNYSKKIMLFGTRRDSNLTIGDSFACFRQGLHFVGQNFQRNKQNNYILHSKFAQLPDEYFGYRLKPQYMHSQNSSPLYSNKNYTKQLTTRIKFNVLSGQKMILNDFPFQQFHVEVSVKGNILDEQNNKTYKSERKTQGFYSEINLQCQFVVYNEELFTIFVVIRNSQNNKILGARSISLKKMRQGLRSIQLFNDRMQTKQNSYLLIHYIKKQIALRDEKASKMHQFLK